MLSTFQSTWSSKRQRIVSLNFQSWKMDLVEGIACCCCIWSSGHSGMLWNPQLVHADTYTVVNNILEGVNLHLRDGWCEGADVFALYISIFALWIGTIDAQSTFLWGRVCQSFEHHPKRCSLAVHEPPWQPKSKQLGDFFKSEFWTCAVLLK